MPNPNWEQIREEWETSKVTLKALAEKHDVKLGTLKSRKSREKWSRDATKKDATKTKGLQPKKERDATTGKFVKGNKVAVGNKGNSNPVNKFTERNTAALKHGLFAKYLPDETLEIVNEIDSISPIDILWMNIKMQFASIMRAQQIMFVNDVDDMTKEVRKEIDSADFESKEYEIQFAWDKQANFLNSQSRAMAELRNMLKQFSEMAHEDDDRLLEVKRIEASIVKTEKETEFIEERTKQIKGEKKDTSMLEALIEGRKQYEQMMKEREDNEQD